MLFSGATQTHAATKSYKYVCCARARDKSSGKVREGRGTDEEKRQTSGMGVGEKKPAKILLINLTYSLAPAHDQSSTLALRGPDSRTATTSRIRRLSGAASPRAVCFCDTTVLVYLYTHIIINVYKHTRGERFETE